MTVMSYVKIVVLSALDLVKINLETILPSILMVIVGASLVAGGVLLGVSLGFERGAKAQEEWTNSHLDYICRWTPM